jgi:transcriptional regulator with XRE-family HTH domain
VLSNLITLSSWTIIFLDKETGSMAFINDEDREIGQRIRKVREGKGISQQKLSEDSGVQITSISAYENGRKAIGLASLRRIVSALDCSYDEILGAPSAVRIGKGGKDGEAKDIAACIAFLAEKGVLKRSVIEKSDPYGGVIPEAMVEGAVNSSALEATRIQSNAAPYDSVMVPYPASPDVLRYVNSRANDEMNKDDIPDISAREKTDRDVLVAKVKKWPK